MRIRLLVVVGLLGTFLGKTSTAQQSGAPVGRQLYFTSDPDRATCLMPEEMAGEESSRCYVMECGAAGDHCICPLKLPNGWKQPLTEDQCRQLKAILRPLPPVATSEAGIPVERLGPDGRVVPPPPGDCTDEQHRTLQDAKNAACNVPRKCTPAQDCVTLRLNHEKNLACIRAREAIYTACFRGGDLVHRTHLANERRAAAKCAEMMDEKKCR